MDGDRLGQRGREAGVSRAPVVVVTGHGVRPWLAPRRRGCSPRSTAATRHSHLVLLCSSLHPCIHPIHLSHPVQCPLLRFTSVGLPPLLTTHDPAEPLRDLAVTAKRTDSAPTSPNPADVISPTVCQASGWAIGSLARLHTPVADRRTSHSTSHSILAFSRPGSTALASALCFGLGLISIVAVGAVAGLMFRVTLVFGCAHSFPIHTPSPLSRRAFRSLTLLGNLSWNTTDEVLHQVCIKSGLRVRDAHTIGFDSTSSLRSGFSLCSLLRLLAILRTRLLFWLAVLVVVPGLGLCYSLFTNVIFSIARLCPVCPSVRLLVCSSARVPLLIIRFGQLPALAHLACLCSVFLNCPCNVIKFKTTDFRRLRPGPRLHRHEGPGDRPQPWLRLRHLRQPGRG